MNAVTEGKRKVGKDLTTGNVARCLIEFTMPLILMNLVQQLYNSVDMIIIGHFVGNTGTVGVSNGGEIATLLTFIATSFGTAGQIYISQLSGAKDKKGVQETVGTLITFMFILSSFLALVCILFCRNILSWLNTPQEAFSSAVSYMVIVSLGLPFVFGYNAACGIMRGLGESKRPLIFVVIAAISNVVMDIFLVIIIPLGAAGTAIATVVAQGVSLGACLIYMKKHTHDFAFEFKIKTWILKKERITVLLKLGVPLASQSALVHFSQVFCTSRINVYGMIASGTNSIGNKINKLLNIFVSSIISGSGAMVGQNIGAGKKERVTEILKVSLAFTGIFLIMDLVLCILLPRQLFLVFGAETDVADFGVKFMHISLIAFGLATIQGPFQAIVTGTGAAKISFVSGVLDGVILRIGISVFLAYMMNLGVVGFFYGNALARIGPVSIGMYYYFSGKWKNKILV